MELKDALPDELGELDTERLLAGFNQLRCKGVPNSSTRRSAVEDAISKIQTSPDAALKTRYVGVKNYSHFGDQRSDHEYGFGPTHGYIVFRIGRSKTTRNKQIDLDEDAIYFLEAMRDFGCCVLASPPYSRDDDEKKIGLYRAVELLIREERRRHYMRTMIENSEDYEFHV